MNFFLQHILLAVLASSTLTALAAPLPESAAPGLSIKMTKRAGNFFVRDDTTELDFTKLTKHIHGLKGKYRGSMKTYKANTGEDHPLKRSLSDEEEAAAEKRATGSSPLTDVQMSLWHGPITLGTQTMACDFDTGSADIIINRSAYTPGKSAKNTKKKFTATYGDGTTASGTVYNETVSVGGVTGKNVAVGRASTDFIDESVEGDVGICGLSYSSISILGAKSSTYFDAVMAQKQVDKAIFTFTMADENSELFVGGISSRVTKPVYAKVDPSQGYWVVPNSNVNGVATSSIVDTGTSLIVAPVDTASDIFTALNVSTFTQSGTLYGYYPCDTPPAVTYKLGKFSQTLSATSLNMGTTNQGQCVLSIVGEDTGLDAIIAGGSLLQNVHAVFDRVSNRIGFSPQ